MCHVVEQRLFEEAVPAASVVLKHLGPPSEATGVVFGQYAAAALLLVQLHIGVVRSHANRIPTPPTPDLACTPR